MELQFACPHCGDPNADVLEVLDCGHVHTIRCERCNEHFYLAVMECGACAHETVLRWGNRPGNAALTRLRCERCDRPLWSSDHGDESADAQTSA